MDIKQQLDNPYNIPLHLQYQKKHKIQKQNQKNQRNNNSLPSITGPYKQQKVNAIRNQIDQTKTQILTLKARINALKLQKQRNEKKTEKHSNQIDFINTVRERLFNDKKSKQDIRDRRERELEYLRQQALTMREKMIKDREMAKSIVVDMKENAAEEERLKKKEDQENIMRQKSIELAQNQLKAKNVKKTQLQIEQKLKYFNESRIQFAQHNHHKKVQRSRSEKQKLDRLLKSLKKEQERMMDECKKSQACMLTTLTELESLNPERKRRNSISSRVALKMD